MDEELDEAHETFKMDRLSDAGGDFLSTVRYGLRAVSGMCGCTGGLLSRGPNTCHCFCRDLNSAAAVVADELGHPADLPGRLGCWGRHQR
ncbi:MAG: hypothetical protein ACRDS9_20905 [Pseudonocardiaceae bacterium]